jgi:hypothetical protein
MQNQPTCGQLRLEALDADGPPSPKPTPQVGSPGGVDRCEEGGVEQGAVGGQVQPQHLQAMKRMNKDKSCLLTSLPVHQ